MKNLIDQYGLASATGDTNSQGSEDGDCMIPADHHGGASTCHHVPMPCPPLLITPKSFQHYISLLPDWDKSLVCDCHHFLNHYDRLIPHLQHALPITAVSDGSNTLDLGSFGWALSRPATESILLEHSAPARGLPMQSFCAKCYGHLSSSDFSTTFFASPTQLPTRLSPSMPTTKP